MINENKIREACASNRERGFKMLMDSFQVPIYNYIRRLVVSHEDAEDVLQEVFIRVFRHIDQFREEVHCQPGFTGLRRMRVYACLTDVKMRELFPQKMFRKS